MGLQLVRLAAVVAFAISASTASAAPPMQDYRAMMAQQDHYNILLQVGMSCKLVTDAEMVLWHRMWNLATVIMLDQNGLRDETAASEALMSQPTTGKARFLRLRKAGCDSTELTAGVRDMRRRMRLAANYFQELQDDHAAARPALQHAPQDTPRP